MEQRDLAHLAKTLGRSVREYVAIGLRTLSERMDRMEERISQVPTPLQGEPGRDGKDADPEFIRAEIQKAVDAIPKPKDGEPGRDGSRGDKGDPGESIIGPAGPQGEKGERGQDAPSVDIPAIIYEIRKSIPTPKDGRDADEKAIIEILKTFVREMVAALPPAKDGKDGIDGKSIDRDIISAMIVDEVTKRFATIPLPKDGRDGRDGINAKDGRDGKDGRDALELDVLDGFDPEKDYPSGTFATKDGGFWRCLGGTRWQCLVDSVVGVSESKPTERLIRTSYRWASGKEIVLERKTVDMIYRKIWKSDTEYSVGDVVTWSGSAWYCQKESTRSQPDVGDDWKLMVREGRAGRSGPDKRPPEPPGPLRLK